MSLINENQRKNAQQQPPKIKPVTTVTELPAEIEVGSVGSGQEFQLSTEQPIPEQPEVPQQQEQSPLDFSLTESNQQPQQTFVPKDPLKLINNSTGANNIWQTIPDDKSPYDSEILQTLKPTTYDNSRVNSDAAALNARGMAGVASSMDNYTQQQRRNAEAEAAIRERVNSRLENTNIPRKQQPWFAGAAQMFSDVLFGSKQSQEEAERNVVNPFKLQYGKQGAGVGGWLKYVLSTPLNATVGLVADWRQGQVDTMVKAGVPRERAQDLVSGKAWVDPFFWQKYGLQQDWSKTQGRSATLDAVTRGESVGDLNDPKGNNKGVFYRESRPTRTAQETEDARLGKYDVFNIGSIGQAIKDDPVGATYEILANVLDPAGNKIGDIVAAGIRGVSKVKPKVPKATGVQTPSVFYPPQKQQRLLPPGKVSSTPVEQQLQELFGKNIPQLSRKPGEARLPPAPEQQLPALPPAYVPPGGFQMPKVNLGSGIPVTGTRVIQPDASRLPTGATRKVPTGFVVFPDEAVEAAEVAKASDPWNAAKESPLQMRATLDNTTVLSKPALKAGYEGEAIANPWDTSAPEITDASFEPAVATEQQRLLKAAPFVAETIENPWLDDSITFVARKFDPVTSAAATPTKAPRILLDDFRVIQKALPPAIDNVTEVVPEAIVGTPSEVVFRVGIGNPSVDPIQFADEITIAGIDDPSAIYAAEEIEMQRLSDKAYSELGLTPEEDRRLEKLMNANASGVTVDAYEEMRKRPIQSTIRTQRQDTAALERSRQQKLQGERALAINTYAELTERSKTENLSDVLKVRLERLEKELTSEEKALAFKQWQESMGIEVPTAPSAQPKPTNVTNTKKPGSLADEAKELQELRNKSDEELTSEQLERLDVLEQAQAAGKTSDSLDAELNSGESFDLRDILPPRTENPWDMFDNPSKPALEQLEQAAEQLASHKAIVQAPLKQLDDYFDTTVDFGRKTTDELPYTVMSPDDVLEAFENNAKLNIPSEAKVVLAKNFGDDIAEALFDADYFSVSEGLTQLGVDLETFVKQIAEVNNTLVTGAKANTSFVSFSNFWINENNRDSVTLVLSRLKKINPSLVDSIGKVATDWKQMFKPDVELKLTEILDNFGVADDDLAKAMDIKNNGNVRGEFFSKWVNDRERTNVAIIYRNLKQKYPGIIQAFDSFSSNWKQTLANQVKLKLTSILKQYKVTEADLSRALDSKIVSKSIENTSKPATKVTLANTIKMPAQVLHGTALDNWQPNYNLRLNGSRGELGSGLYVTNRKSVAEDYAKAVISENASPGTNASDIAPAVHELTGTFVNTFSARGKLSTTDPIVKALVNSLPEQLKESVQKSLYRDKTTSYIGFLNKMEASLVRSGLYPDESVLKDISNRISNALRELGYDSVYDSKSGFGLVLDESKITVTKSSPVPKATSATQAAIARYNADAYAAKFYPERLTTDANLRDSAYKLLSQVEATIDDKLQSIQREIINRGLDKQQTILPSKQTYRSGNSVNDSKPATASELMNTIEPKSTNPCEL